jgi:osmoprotectant transport system ATP-binding protein
MINRLVEPTSGTIELFGRDVRSVPAPELRRGIGYVIQQGGLFPHRTVAANIGTVPSLLGWDKAKVRERVGELAGLLDLDPDLLRRYPAALSGGQRQRVGVARALAANPPVLLMDEPYSAVDPVVRARLQDDLLLLQRKVRKTVVLVTHDIEEAVKLADRIVLLGVGGQVLQDGTPDELLRAPAGERVGRFLGQERALRRLGLRTCSELELGPPGGAADGSPSVPASATAREALDVLVATGAGAVVVRTAEGAELGWLDLARISAALAGADER